MVFKNEVHLSKDNIAELWGILDRGVSTAQLRKRAHALLLANQGLPDSKIAEMALLSVVAVEKIRKRFVIDGFELTLYGRPRPGRPPILTEKDEAELIALACSDAPDGRARHTTRELADVFVTEDGRHVSHQTIYRVLRDKDIKPWQKKMWCIPPEDKAEFTRRQNIVLDAYEAAKEHPDPKRPLVCADESPVQLLGEVRDPIPVRPGSPMKVDSEYKRFGTANMFVFVSPFLGERRIDVTDKRTRTDFALQIEKLVNEDYPDAKEITLVLDNLNTHNEKSIYDTFAPSVAKKILKRIKFIHTPVHGSWLNAAEIEIGRVKRSGIKGRVDNKKDLIKQVKAFVKRSNKDKVKINWNYTSEDAKASVKRHQPKRRSAKRRSAKRRSAKRRSASP